MKKRLIDGFRIALCAAALWLVVRSVSLHDQVVLKANDRMVTGLVTVRGDELICRLKDGGTEVLSLAQVAVDEQGGPQITYGLMSGWQQSRKEFLLVAALAFAIVPLLQAYRIRALLDVDSIHVGYWDALKISFAGNFLNFAAPLGSTAGDVFKAYYVSLHTDRKTEAMTTVFLDRVIGLATLIGVVSLITILSPADGRLGPLRSYMLVLIVVGAVVGIAYVSPPLRRLTIWNRLLSRLPMSDQLQRIDRTALRLARRTRVLGGAVFTTVVLQIFAALSFFFVAIAMGLTANAGNALEYYAYFSTGELVKALPGPPQGLGTMELAYGYLFAPFGGASQILCAAFAIRIVTLICALPGALVTLTGSYKPAPAPTLGSIGAPVLQLD